MFFKSKKQPKGKIILGMIMLKDNDGFNLDNFSADFTSSYEHTIDNLSGDQTAASFEVDGETVAIGHMPVPIPNADLESTAEYAYTWQTAREDLKDHESHLIVSLLGKGSNQILRYTIFTQVICSLLRTTDSIGVYKGNQSLLIPKNDYLEEAALMSDDYFPLDLWIYFGLRATSEGNSGYTYGLQEFNKNELEILNSSQDILSIRNFLFNMAHYVLEFDITFKDGQTCGMSEEEKVKITFSKGVLVEGKTFKLAYL